MIFAAIDIGSNAARLLFAHVFEIKKEVFVENATLVRIPTRLGEDVYSGNTISKEKADRLIKTLKAFQLLIEAYKPVDYDVCATAAMREAGNGHEIIDRINHETGFRVRVIDGIEEARIIRLTNKMGFRHPDKLAMYIDVGGGSTDISIMENHRISGVKSFEIGTLRLLKNKVRKKEWEQLKAWLFEYREHFGSFHLVGSGGNINKINKLYGDSVLNLLSFKKLKKAHRHLNSFSFDERVEKLGLRPDRADVIIPAAKIFMFIMKTVKANEILVPKIGLADGLIYRLYEEWKKNQTIAGP
jgi:exopolyphosphatase / guanosine-5'-triphosphate,3'-diphosphate pyrophosphatase